MSTNHPRSEFFVLRKLTHTTHTTKPQTRIIYLTKHIPTSTLFIEKRFHPSLSTSPSTLREITALTRLNPHPHIISLFAHIPSPYTSLYLQHCPLGSLDSFIRNNIALPDEGFLWKIFWDLALAVCFLATGFGYEEARLLALGGSGVKGKKEGWESLIHGDVRPKNVFLTWDQSGTVQRGHGYPRVVLSGFACVRTAGDGEARGLGEDQRFSPPEEGLEMSRDVWGVGIVLHCVFLGRRVPVTRLVEAGRPLGGNGSGASGFLERGVEACLARRPGDRPTPGELPNVVREGCERWVRSTGRAGRGLSTWRFEESSR